MPAIFEYLQQILFLCGCCEFDYFFVALFTEKSFKSFIGIFEQFDNNFLVSYDISKYKNNYIYMLIWFCSMNFLILVMP